MADQKFVATHDVYILTKQLFSIPKKHAIEGCMQKFVERGRVKNACLQIS